MNRRYVFSDVALRSKLVVLLFVMNRFRCTLGEMAFLTADEGLVMIAPR